MDNIHPTRTSTQTLERILSSIAVAICLIECLWIGQALSHQQPIWPLPSMYLVEAGLVSIICWLGVMRSDTTSSTFSVSLVWAMVGVLAAFVAMGVWSIGFLFIPVTLLFAITAILIDHRQNNSILLHLGVGALSALTQVALMLFVVRFI